MFGRATAALLAPESSTGIEFSQLIQSRHLSLLHSQGTLQYPADETGALAKLDTNDMAGAVSSIVADLGESYLIGYAPDAGTFDERGFPLTHAPLDIW
jgi:hypothetical protein